MKKREGLNTEIVSTLDQLKDNVGQINELGLKVLEYLLESTKETEEILYTADYVPYVSEVEKFNKTFGKPNNYTPTIPSEKEWRFVYDFILEELEEYKQACESGDIVEILDALGDITYVSTGNGTMLHGLKDKFFLAYREIQDSNMSKSCRTEKEAEETVRIRSAEQGEGCHYEAVGDRFVVYRTRDRKVMKSINYRRPNLKKFFTEQELENVRKTKNK